MALRVGVVGSGVVGAAAALQAARLGAQVWLFEPRPPAPPNLDAPPGLADLGAWPNRHVALSPASQDFLADLGVPTAVRAGRFDRMQVWEQLGTAGLDFCAREVGQQALASMVELPDLVTALWSRVCEIPSIRRVEDAIDGIDAVGAQWRLSYGAGAELTVDWVLAADGARSAARDLTGQQARTRATGHAALATVARTEQPHDNIARQRFLVDGPLALLPTREPQVVSVVWSQPPDAAQARLALPDDAFCHALGLASEGVLGAVQAVGVRGAFPIVELMAADFAPLPGLAFVGDAAHVVHPLAGLGVNLGLEDVIALRPVLSMALAQNGAGERDAWRSWRRQRRARSVLVQRSLAGLQRFFAADTPLASWVRNLGVRAVNRAGPMRRAIIREAMGL